MRSAARRYGPWSIALPAFAAAIAAMATPNAGGSTGAGATCLAVGALALLAGHTWGLLVLVPAHVAIVGRLWPTIAIGPSALPSGDVAAVTVVLVAFVPVLALGAVALPGIIGHLLPDRTPRARALVVSSGALLLAAALVVPAFMAHSAAVKGDIAAKPVAGDMEVASR